MYVRNKLRIAALGAVMASASMLVTITTASNAVAATASPRATAHAVPWPFKPDTNPVCGSRNGETFCAEATSNTINVTWNHYPLPKKGQVPGSEGAGADGFTIEGKNGQRLSQEFTLGKPGPATFKLRGVTPGVEYNGSGTLSVGPPGSTAKSVDFLLYVGPQTNDIVNKGLRNGQVGSHYSVTLRATGGGPYTWQYLKKIPGLSLKPSASGSTAVLSGTPTRKGSFTVTARVTNGYKLVAQKSFPVKIAA